MSGWWWGLWFNAHALIYSAGGWHRENEFIFGAGVALRNELNVASGWYTNDTFGADI